MNPQRALAQSVVSTDPGSRSWCRPGRRRQRRSTMATRPGEGPGSELGGRARLARAVVGVRPLVPEAGPVPAGRGSDAPPGCERSGACGRHRGAEPDWLCNTVGASGTRVEGKPSTMSPEPGWPRTVAPKHSGDLRLSVVHRQVCGTRPLRRSQSSRRGRVNDGLGSIHPPMQDDGG